MMMPRKATHLVLVVTASAVVLAVSASQTVTRGGPQKNPVVADRPSPLTLEMDMAAADRSLWGEGKWFSTPEYRAVGKLTCDGVSLRSNYSKRRGTWDPGLEMAARERRDGTVEVKVRATVNNPNDNEDKNVTVRLEVLNGDDLVQSGTIGPIEAEDNGNDVGGQTTLVIPAAALKSTPMTRLRITVTVKDD